MERKPKGKVGFVSKRLNALRIFFRRTWKAKTAPVFVALGLQNENGLRQHVLTQYLLKELFLYFLVAFLFFFMVFFVNQILLVAESILKQRVPVGDVSRLILYSLPTVISQSSPFATLVGFLMCLGRLASENEILILRASGQRYRVILVPVVILGLLISIASFFVNDYLLPLGYINYAKLYREIQTSNPSVALEPNSIKRTRDKTLVIGDVVENEISDLIFFDTDSDGNQRMIISGKSVVEDSDDTGVLLRLSMDNPIVAIFDIARKMDYDFMVSEKLGLNIFESNFSNGAAATSPREMTSYDLRKKIAAMKNQKDISKKQMNNYVLEYHKKFSIPFGALFFAILSVPLALIFGKHNGQTIGLIIGIVISVLYWAVNIVGQIFSSRSGEGAFATMWIPNLAIGISGILFYLKLIRK